MRSFARVTCVTLGCSGAHLLGATALRLRWVTRRKARLRIIGGSLRGRSLGSVPDGVRPTSDRVRESLFAVLGDLTGRHVLDLFAGTGALGLEAYSRGAERVVFVERSSRVARALRKRLAALSLDDESGIELVNGEATRVLRRLESRAERGFDLVFLDPPYADLALRDATLEVLLASPLLDMDSTVVVEGLKRHALPPLSRARIADERRYGDTVLTWLAPVGQVEE